MMKLKYLVLFSLSTFGFASPQIPELLIYKNDTIPIYNLIIEEYFQKNEKRTGKNRFEQLGVKDIVGITFVAARGYQGVYKIENDSLFVVDIISQSIFLSQDNEVVELNQIKSLFKDQYKNGKVFVDWFSGNIAMRDGDLLRWDGVFVRKFEKEKVIRIEKGIFKNIIEVQNYIDLPNGINRRYNDKITDEIFKEIEKIEWKDVLEYDCSEKYEFTIGKNGRIKDVEMVNYQTKQQIEDFWDKKEFKYCMKTIKSSVRNLQFDLVKGSGRNIEEVVWLEIWVNDDGTVENWNF